MWDDDHDKQMMRNQMRAILLMTALLFAWYYFFVPQQQPPPQQPPPAEQTAAETPEQQPGTRPDEPRLTSDEEVPAAEDEFWGQLPPVAEPEPENDTVSISDEYLVLEFTRIGGRLKRAVVRLGDEGENSLQLIPEFDGTPDTEAAYPLGLWFPTAENPEALNRRRFDYELDPSGRAVTFSLTLPGKAVVKKSFSLSEDAHVLDVDVTYENLETGVAVVGMDDTPAYILNWSPDLRTDDEDSAFSANQFVWRTGEENETLTPGDLPVTNAAPQPKRIRQVDWMAYKTKYFLVAFKPEFEQADGWAVGSSDNFRFGLTGPRFDVPAGGAHSYNYRLYVGPLELKSLGEAWPTLSTTLRFFDTFDSMDWFAKLLLSILHWFHENTIANYGIAIILLTLLVRTIMLPLTMKSMRSMKRMQALAPEMEALKEKYKDDQQEFSRKMMEMYRERGVNPLGGCFPMLIQMPVFIALYRMLWNAFELRGAPFLWVDDLSKPDRLLDLPFMEGIPFLGAYLDSFNLLPILMGAALVLNMKVMPTGPVQNPQQKMIMTIMPIMFTVFCYPLAAGLNLYVFTSTVLGMVQQMLVRASTSSEEPPPVKRDPKKKKQNFYARAQERKRQMAKEAKKEGKKKSKARR